MTRSDADRRVAAGFVSKQYDKVQRSLEAVVALSQDPRILSVQVIGNGSHENYNLPPSYNREMGKHFSWLAERGTNGLSSALLASGGKYDDYHLHDHSYNRKLVYRFLRGAITLHLKYVEIMAKKAQLRWFAENFIANEQDRREAIRLFPTIVQFRLALARTQEVMLAMSPQERTATPAEEFDNADEDILMWVHAGIQEAEQEATREGRPEAENFTDAEMASIVPVDPRLEDAETEEQRGRLFLQEDLQQAQDDGFSIATVESIELSGEITDTEADVEIVPDVDNWDVIDPEAKAITNPFDEKVKEDEVGEERRKEVEDLNKILALTSASGMLSGTKATDEGAFTRMEGSVDENAAKKADEPELTGTEADAPRKDEPSSSATEAKDDKPAATEVVDVEKADEPIDVDKPAGKPAEKAMPKPEKKKSAPESKPMPRAKAPKLDAEVDRALKKLEEATEAAEQAVWLDPDDMASHIPKECVGNGRARYISTKLSYLVQGHAIENGRLSPEFDPLELCMDFEETMKVINRYIRGVTIKEVLSVVRNNETRRFQIKVTKPGLPDATWKGLPWKVIKIRAVQGHNKSVMSHAKLSNIVKRVFTLDPTFKKEDLDGNKFPMTNLRPDLAPELLKDLPRVIYHSCDRSAMEKIIQHGLIPGGWPQRTGRAHNHFIATHPWDIGAKKLAGTRAGKQYYMAFDTELVVQNGCRLFQTDQAILSPDWVSNEALICCYDAINREFAWINRPYELTRNGYNAKMKEAREESRPKNQALIESTIATAKNKLRDYLQNNILQPGRMDLTDEPKRLPPVNRVREGKDGLIKDQIELRSGYFGALSLADTVRWGKGKGRGKGKGSHPGGKAVENSRNPDDYIFNRKLEQQPVPCHFCKAENIEGTHKCQSCFRWLVGWTDGRIATEVCRLERTAKMNNGIFALDKIDFEKQPRAQRVSDRSNFGNVRDAATTHAGRYAKLGFVSIRDRMERDPYYLLPFQQCCGPNYS
eukprot:s912_g34.t1